jgi:hypothetical protein
MKTLLLSALALFSAGSALAAKPVCSYKLDQEEYWEKADGDLVMDGVKYRCESVGIADDQLTLCKKVGNSTKNFDLIVGFDGAEGSFFVFRSLAPEAQELCSGVATVK